MIDFLKNEMMYSCISILVIWQSVFGTIKMNILRFGALILMTGFILIATVCPLTG